MDTLIQFGKIDRAILFGGGDHLFRTIKLLQSKGIEVLVCSAPRHLDGLLSINGPSLRQQLQALKLEFIDAVDVNQANDLLNWITPNTLGLGFGPAWIFGPEICDAFGLRLVNFMGIRMPQYFGGAHYTWQILRQNRLGAANFQIIEKSVNTGPVIFNREYRFPPSCQLPEDFFDFAAIQDDAATLDFVNGLLSGAHFIPKSVDKNFEFYFPSLNTMKQGWIDWSWPGEDVANFINAFGRPYAGASTDFAGSRVFLHEAIFDPGEGRFHPFQVGMIYRRSHLGLFIATTTGAVIIGRILDQHSKDVSLDKFKKGGRFFTETSQLQQAMKFSAIYTGAGLK